MNPEEIKRYFEHNPPPKEVRLAPWANITDTQVFLRSYYLTIRNFSGPVERCPAFWHLRDFYILMKKTPAAQAPAPDTAWQDIPQDSSNQALSDQETAV